MSIQYSPKIVTNGLIFYVDAGNTKSYPGTGTAWYDRSGYGKNTTLVNGPTFNSSNGGSIVFDGVDDYVNVTPPLLSGISQFTYSSFNKFTNNGNTGLALFSYGNYYDYPNDILFYWSSNQLHFQIGNGADGGGNYTYAVSNTWANTTLVFDGTQSTNDTRMKFYVNGIQQTAVSFDYTVPSSTYNSLSPACNIGAYIGIGGFNFCGNIANTMLHNRALSQTEVTQNYNALKSRFGL